MAIISFKRLNYLVNQPFQIKEQKINTDDLKEDEILVKVTNAALNPADLIVYNSAWVMFWNRKEKGVGLDYSGIVKQAGSKITDFKAGDRIAGLYKVVLSEQGAFSEYLKLKPADDPSGLVPKNLSMAEASSFPLVFATAYSTCFSFHRPNIDSRVLVIGGATSVGSYTIQLLKNHFKVKSIASVNSTATTELTKSFGADYVVDYTKGKVAQDVKGIVDKEYNGEKFDLIVDCVGSDDLFPVMDDVLKPKITNSGFVSVVGDKIADYNKSFFNTLSLSLFYKLIPFFRNYNYGFNSPNNDWYPVAKELFEQGKLTPYIDSQYDFKDFEVAFKKLASHKARGKVVLKIGDDVE